MNALIDSWSSASSVGEDDHPEMRMSPESAAAVPPALALGDVVLGLPHAPMISASSVMTESNALRFNKETPPACVGRRRMAAIPCGRNRTPAFSAFRDGEAACLNVVYASAATRSRDAQI